MKLQLFDKKNIEELPYIDNIDAKYAAAYLVPMIKNGVNKYLGNVHGEMKILAIDTRWLLPVFVPKINKSNAYVASIYSHYISYCFDELKELRNKRLEKAAKILLHILGFLLKTAQIDKTVFINNWLLSTNLYTDFPKKYIKEITEYIARNHKGYAVAWNSINECTTKDIYDEMQAQNYLFIPSRSIYIVNRYDGFPRRIKRELCRDQNLLNHSKFNFEKISYENSIIKLYNNLYIEKYSQYNPKFTNEFAKLLEHKNLLKFFALKDTDYTTVGVLGYFIRQGVMTAPMVGYDFTYDKSAGLYRQLTIKMFLDAKKHGYILNASSGVGQFKRNRGAERFWEYRVIYTKTINKYRRLIFKILQTVISKIGVPMMDKMKL